MKTFGVILFCLVFFQPEETYYYQKEEVCSYSYSITKEYHLTLKTQNEFQFSLQISDTRGMNTVNESIGGVLEHRRDTIILKIKNDQSKIYYPKEVLYLFRGDSLKILNRDFLFPEALKKTSNPQLTPFFIKPLLPKPSVQQ